ncbi:gag-pol fusion protein [Cystoisospora suis]|uniref:Gag-pol fusion protein n=1 Tax=Cystoisospora suis TaxID=483139 RepID=A0A2C6KI16_9APIC|nr:gag-pol fusion protein [Cystoisospora suis]
MKTLGNALACSVMDKGGEWDRYCAAIAFAYRTSPHPSTGESPFRVVYRIDSVLPIDRQLTDDTNILAPSLTDRFEYLKKIRNDVFEQLHKRIDHGRANTQVFQLLPGSGLPDQTEFEEARSWPPGIAHRIGCWHPTAVEHSMMS